MPFIDDILSSQDSLSPGDMILFHRNAANNFRQRFFGRLFAVMQLPMRRDGWPVIFLHTGLCTGNDQKGIVFLHLTENGLRSNHLHYPAGFSFLIVRPPAHIRARIIELTQNEILSQNISINADPRVVFANSRPVEPVWTETLSEKNNCLGFVINILQMAWQTEMGCPFPLSDNISPARFLKHITDLKRDHADFSNWKILLFPCPPREGHEPVDHLLRFVEQYCDTLATKTGIFKKDPKEKQKKIQEALMLFAEHRNPGDTALEETQHLLRVLREPMEKTRTFRKSKSFSELLKSLDDTGVVAKSMRP